MDFDPSVVSYGELVDLAFASHDPRWKAHKTQYASLVLAHDDEQLAVAHERAGARFGTTRRLACDTSRAAQAVLARRGLPPEVLPAERPGALRPTSTRCSTGTRAAFRESTSAARVNGYVAGDGTRVQLAREIEFLGLSENSRARLITRVGDLAERHRVLGPLTAGHLGAMSARRSW